ncbi:polysaccharide deacetylase family protein [Enterococcus innesii]|uniref:polysaccharide deacetylase family protein n=1 Tax=Enterococcus innesii TaxID=2839759 RepID=UPI0022B9A157|nr:polysaccharide deacetylase family protein [Enterococcus innesii]
MKKNFLLIAISCALILTSLVGIMYKYLVGEVQLKEKKDFEIQIEQIIKTELFDQGINQTENLNSGYNKYNKYYMYYLGTEDRNIINKLTDQTQMISEQMKYSRSMIFSYVTEEKENDMIINRNLVTKKYVWDEKEKLLNYFGEVNELTEILLSNNRNDPRLVDIVNDEADFLAIKRIIQEEVLNTYTNTNSTVGNEAFRHVFTNEFITKNSQIKILPYCLEITFDQDILGIEKINVGFEKILPFINYEIVSGRDISKKELDQNGKYIALTFDDGPNDSSTIKLLEILKKENISATFFVLGNMVNSHPEVAKQIVEEGHEIGNHSYSHPDMTQISPDEVREEIFKTDKAVFHATGVLPSIFRPPYGAINEVVAKSIGLPIIQWNVDSEDWKLRDKDLIVDKVVSAAEKGSIILIHDIHKISVESVPEIVDKLRKSGYEFATISELLSYSQKPLNQYFSLDDKQEIK